MSRARKGDVVACLREGRDGGGIVPDEPDRWLFGVPRDFEDPGPGFGRIEVEGSDRLVHISDRGDERLYLVFDEAGASDLAFFFALLPLSIVLLLMYLLLFVAFVGRTGRCRPSCASPVSCRRRLRGQRSRRARAWRLASPHQRRGRDALDQLAARINAAIDHERLFTRDAGHELRTPVAVFNGSLDLLETAPSPVGTSATNRRSSGCGVPSRTRRRCWKNRLLVRGEAAAPVRDETSVNEVVATQVDELRALANEKTNVVTLHESVELRVGAPEKVVRMVFGTRSASRWPIPPTEPSTSPSRRTASRPRTPVRACPDRTPPTLSSRSTGRTRAAAPAADMASGY